MIWVPFCWRYKIAAHCYHKGGSSSFGSLHRMSLNTAPRPIPSHEGPVLAMSPPLPVVPYSYPRAQEYNYVVIPSGAALGKGVEQNMAVALR
jgi:hypothetical protein